MTTIRVGRQGKQTMASRVIRIILTIGLIPLWVLGVYAGLLISPFGGAVILSLVNKESQSVQWTQPPRGAQVIDIRLSHGDYCQRCGVLAMTSAGHIYLYSQEGGDQTTFEVTDVTDKLGAGNLPSSFILNWNGLEELQMEGKNSVRHTEQVDLNRLAALPPGDILNSGSCYIGCSEGMRSAMDAAVIEGSGLWLMGYSPTGGLYPQLISPDLVLVMGAIICFSAVLMTVTTTWLFKRVWSG